MGRHRKKVIEPSTGATLNFDRQTRQILAGCGRLQCTQEETAAMLGVSLNTLRALFDSEPLARILFRDSFAEGKVSLRRTQFRLAEKSASMAIFLGKNWLGQSDNQSAIAGDITVNIVQFGGTGTAIPETAEPVDVIPVSVPLEPPEKA